MSAYPGLPDNRLIVNGVDLSTAYRMVLLDGYTLEPPEPKTYTVDIPGGNGVIDLTEALLGDVVYNNRKQEFEFAVIDPAQNFEKIKTELMNFLHGRKFDYQLTMDPGYTYHGRFSVTSFAHTAYSNGLLCDIKISIDADPYKTKEKVVYNLNCTGGKFFNLESGRRPVHPVMECTETCTFTHLNADDPEEIIVPAGTYQLNNVLFRDGWNQVWINSHVLYLVKWDDLNSGGEFEGSYDHYKDQRWDGIHKLGVARNEALDDVSYQSWNDLIKEHRRWNDETIKSMRWTECDWSAKVVISDSYVYLKYDWEDL